MRVLTLLRASQSRHFLEKNGGAILTKPDKTTFIKEARKVMCF